MEATQNAPAVPFVIIVISFVSKTFLPSAETDEVDPNTSATCRVLHTVLELSASAASAKSAQPATCAGTLQATTRVPAETASRATSHTAPAESTDTRREN